MLGTDSIAKLSQGRKNRYKGREGVSVDDSPGEECEPVIVYVSVYGPKSGYVWIVWCLEQGTRCWESYKVICDLAHHQESTVYATLV